MFLFLVTQPRYFRGYFVRQVFNDIRDSLFRDFKDRLEDNPSLNAKDFHIRENDMRITHLPTGNMILSKGISKDGSRTAKMKSLAGATHVLIEEADEVGESDFDQLDLSLRTTKSEGVKIIRIFNPPPRRHWIWRDYNLNDSETEGWYNATPKVTSDITSVFSTYHDNIKNIQPSTVQKFEAFLESNPDYYYNQVLGLISDGAKGRVYSGWRSITDEKYDSLDLPKAYALDFGYSEDPTALLEVKYEKNFRYVRELIYEPGLTNEDLAKRMRDLGITTSDVVVADVGAGGDLRIAELRRGFKVDEYPDLWFNIYPSIKGPGSINFGINKIKDAVVHLTESSVNAWNEYQEYRWRLDINKMPTDTPMDKYNHLMDALRYFENSKERLF